MALPRLPFRSTRALLVGFVLASLPAVLQAQAQATTGVIRGTDLGLHGCPVVRRHRDAAPTGDQRAQRSLTTNASGVYRRHAASGRSLRCQRASPGFPGIQARTACRSAWARRSRLDFALAPQVVQLEELTVTAEPVLDVTELGIGHPAERRGGRGAAQQRAKRLQLHDADPERGHVQGPDGDEISIGGQRGHPQQRLGGRGGLQQPVLRRAARRPAAGVYLQSRRGAGLRGGLGWRQRRVRPIRRRLRQHHHQVRAPTSSTARPTTSASTTTCLPTTATLSRAVPPPALLLTLPQHQFGATLRRTRWSATRRSSSWPTTSRSTTRPSRPTASALSTRRCWPSWIRPSAERFRGTSGRSAVPTTPTSSWASSTSGWARIAQRVPQVQLHQFVARRTAPSTSTSGAAAPTRWSATSPTRSTAA